MTRDIKPRGECGGCDKDVWEPADARKDRENPHLKPEHKELLKNLQAEGKL
jgi:hypothetical protein